MLPAPNSLRGERQRTKYRERQRGGGGERERQTVHCLFIWVRLCGAVILTNWAETVDFLTGGRCLHDVDVVQDVVTVIAKCQCQRNHVVAIDTWLPGKVIVSSQAFSSHAVEQLMRLNWNKHGTGYLQTHTRYNMLDISKIY